MKMIYIVGLEHSGTTLCDHLLSTSEGVLSLGEITSFLSPSHMRQYMRTWGSYPDVSLCSCGKAWDHCDFWGDTIALSGLNSDESIASKYKKLSSYITATRGDDIIVVDSSKQLGTLEMLLDGHCSPMILPSDVAVVFAIKDVRSFSASMVRKKGHKKSLISVLRTFNYWHGANKGILDFLIEKKVEFSLTLYEELCADPGLFINRQLAQVGHPGQTTAVNIHNNTSHIAMGNKNFLLRNRSKVKYDSRWYHDDEVNFSYLLHRRARAFNEKIYDLYQTMKKPLDTAGEL